MLNWRACSHIGNNSKSRTITRNSDTVLTKTKHTKMCILDNIHWIRLNPRVSILKITEAHFHTCGVI